MPDAAGSKSPATGHRGAPQLSQVQEREKHCLAVRKEMEGKPCEQQGGKRRRRRRK